MLYAVLIYDLESEVGNLPPQQLDELISRHGKVQEQLAAQDRLGPVVRLMPTTSAKTLRQKPESMLIDGPFAETKEQLLGFYVVDCPDQEEAMKAAKLIGGACNARTLEVRPIQLYYPAPK